MKSSDKYEIVNQITSLLEENTRLKKENEYLSSICSSDLSFNSLQNRIYEQGREYILMNCLNDWHEARIIIGGDEGYKAVEPYEDWINHALDPCYIPSWISLDDFMKVFDDILKDRYEIQKQEALNKLAESEE